MENLLNGWFRLSNPANVGGVVKYEVGERRKKTRSVLSSKVLNSPSTDQGTERGPTPPRIF
jgi:hypothetical protein